MRWSEGSLVVFLCLLPALAGCAPKENKGTTVDVERTEWTIQAVQDAIRYGEPPFSSGQLTVMAGRPDAQVAVRDAVKVLPKGDNCSPASVEEFLEQVYRGYLRSLDRQPADEDWHEVQDFLQCELWLYHWAKPSPTYVSGLIPKKVGVSSEYFLVRNNGVIDAGHIIRPPAED